MNGIFTELFLYWAIQRSWFARVNALCNLWRKKSREVAAHFRADFWVGVASRCVWQWKLKLDCEAVQMAILLQLQKLPWKKDGGWTKSVFASFFGLARRSRVSLGKKCVLGHPKARATSYCLFPDTFWLRASKNAFNVGSVKFANSLSPPSIVKKVRTGSKSSQGT